jgi:hypothetical protein
MNHTQVLLQNWDRAYDQDYWNPTLKKAVKGLTAQ